jgi:SNF2 family DNA or RNA helicase
MMERSKVDLFEWLKTNNTQEKYFPRVFFQISFDKKGSYIRVTDDRNNEIDPHPEHYSGETGKVLSILRSIKKENTKNIDWSEDSRIFGNRVYISHYPSILDHLLNCSNFINSRFQPIKFSDETAEVRVLIEGENDLKSRFCLFLSNSLHYHIFFLTENYAFSSDSIYRIKSIGVNFDKTNLFETEFNVNKIEEYLSLLYSNFDNVSVDYKDYSESEVETRTIEPSIIFHKVDETRNLYIRLSKALTGFKSKFLENYSLNRVVHVNEMTKTLNISNIVEKDIQSSFEEFEKLLQKYKKSIHTLNDYFYIGGTYVIQENLAKEIIYKEINSLLSKFSVVGLEKLQIYNIRTVKPKLHVSLTHGIDFLEGDINIEIDNEMIPLAQVLNSYNKNSYITLKDGTNAIISKTYIDKLRRLFRKDKDKIKISFFDLPIIEDLIEEKIFSESFVKAKEVFLGFNKIDENEVELPAMNSILRNYQVQGYKWLKYLQEHLLGGCLADDMGLGKTVQTIALLSSLYPQETKSTLIVMPKSLLFNWENELNKFNPELTYYTFYGQTRDMAEARKKNIILTTYAMLRNEIDKFREEFFLYVVLDESQNIKNSGSQISRAVMLLQAKYRLGLSGTPIENNLGELYSLFRFLNPAMFGSIDEFNRNYGMPIQKDNDRSVTEELRRKIYPFVLRRLKKEVLKELPDKIEQTLFVEMSPEQKEFYEQRRLFYYHNIKEQINSGGIKKSQFYILQALSELRQIASIPESKTDKFYYLSKKGTFNG